MQVVLVKREKIYRFPFPIDETTTSYWLTDVDDDYNERNLISLEKIDDKWNLVSNSTCYIEVGEKQIKNALLSVGLFYSLKIVDANNNISSALLYVENEEKETYITYNVVQNGEYTIGNRDDQNIRLRSSVVNNAHAVLTKNEKGFFIRSLDTKYGIYINDNKTDERSLENGDIVCYDPKYLVTDTGFLKTRFIDDKASVVVLLMLLDYTSKNSDIIKSIF